MIENLVQAIVDKKVFNKQTELEIVYDTLTIGGVRAIKAQGTYTIDSIKKVDGKLVFEVLSTKDGSRRITQSENIISIDGMDPYRFASVYSIKPNGGKVNEGKRRGRKPKPKELNQKTKRKIMESSLDY